MFNVTHKTHESCVDARARDAIKLALLGFRHLVDWWGLPTRLEWALAPDRGAGVAKLGPGLDAGLRASA